jgi:hypothetical protein
VLDLLGEDPLALAPVAAMGSPLGEAAGSGGRVPWQPELGPSTALQEALQVALQEAAKGEIGEAGFGGGSGPGAGDGTARGRAELGLASGYAGRRLAVLARLREAFAGGAPPGVDIFAATAALVGGKLGYGGCDGPLGGPERAIGALPLGSPYMDCTDISFTGIERK